MMMTTPTAVASSSSTDVNSSSHSQEEMMTHEERLQLYLLEQNILELPPAPKAAANYCPCQRSGDLLYLSGHLPFSSIILDENNNNTTTTTLEPYTGRLGGSSSSMDNDGDNSNIVMEPDAVTMGYNAAKQAGLNIIATIRNELGGSINNVDQMIKLFGLVQSTDDFHQQHLVMNGCSDVMTHVFGPIVGKHARSAVGTNALPLNSMIEIEAIVRLKPSSSLPPPPSSSS